MQPIVTDGVALSGHSVCLSVMIVSSTKTDEPIVWVVDPGWPVGPKKHVLDGALNPQIRRGNLEGEGRPIVKYRNSLRELCKKMAELIEMPVYDAE